MNNMNVKATTGSGNRINSVIYAAKIIQNFMPSII